MVEGRTDRRAPGDLDYELEHSVAHAETATVEEREAMLEAFAPAASPHRRALSRPVGAAESPREQRRGGGRRSRHTAHG